MTDEELDAHLRAKGVRLGNREKSIKLLESWIGKDLAPEDTVEEWEEIQRNIENTRRWYEEPSL